MPSELRWPEALAALDSELQAYFQFHRNRYEFLHAKVAESVGRLRQVTSRELLILDVGLSFQTQMVQRSFPDSIVNTLGFGDPRFQEGLRGRHFAFNLNDARDPALWLQVPPHDLVLMAEVLEHIFVPTAQLLACVAGWMAPGGELLLQTPNAVSLGKRWRMLLGHNPYMMLRDRYDPSGHVREYTVAELVEAGRQAGLKARERSIHNYFHHVSPTAGLYRGLCALLPESFRDGITISYVKP